MIKYLLIIIGILLILFLGLCHLIGKQFLGNLKKRQPGEKFNVKNMDISFYTNGPLAKIAKNGLAYIDTLEKEDVYIESFDHLKLHGYLFMLNQNSKKFLIGVHGFQSHALNEFAPHIRYYQEKGFNLLLVDDRAHGYSEGEYITMGVKDRLDVINWAKYLVEEYGTDIKILLHGVSMGAATVLSTSSEKGLPTQVKGIISDCGFSSNEAAFANQIKTLYKINPNLILKICKWYAKHRAGFDFAEARPIDQVKNSRVPILFVQGVNDFMVPKQMAVDLYTACSSKKKLLLVEGANHAESIAINPNGYHRAIEELFDI